MNEAEVVLSRPLRDRKLTPYQRIMRAARDWRGVRLSMDDVQALSLDDAIATRATIDDESQISGSPSTEQER